MSTTDRDGYPDRFGEEILNMVILCEGPNRPLPDLSNICGADLNVSRWIDVEQSPLRNSNPRVAGGAAAL